MQGLTKHRRVKDRAVLDAYRAAHPWCEVWLCGEASMPTPHHLIHPGGSDRVEEIISLCWKHHVGPEGWHPLGKHRWFARFKDRLTADTREKIERVLHIKR